MTEAQHAAEWITGPISLEHAAAEHKAQKLADELAKARAECERMREALRPFGYEAVFDGYGGAYISPIRRARATLEGR